MYNSKGFGIILIIYTTVTNFTIRKDNKVIVMEDINAKITHNTKYEHQLTSRNGKLLNQMMKQTGTTTINNKPNHV